MRTELRFAGFGGQGIISAGVIAGRAAALHDKKNAVMTQSYGPEARGGACHANVVVSEDPITYPKVICPNLLVIMSQEAFTCYSREITPGGMLIVDEDLVKDIALDGDIQLYSIPATRIAKELGNKIVANVVMLGAIAALSHAIRKKALLESVRESVPARFLELNERAFEAGYEYGEGIKA
jgi:2-oxoglutarate ferredoxin oxidoreductase subunit gamma